MEWRCLELKVISCKDLKAFNFFQKLSVYSVVSIVMSDEQAKKKKKKKDEEQQCEFPQRQRQKTCIDKSGNKNPEWNHVFQFDLKSSLGSDQDMGKGNLFLKFDLRRQGFGFVPTSIGEVLVPLKDLVHEFRGVVRFVSYQVRNSDGKPNGVLNFSYKLMANDSQKVVYPKLDLELEDHHHHHLLNNNKIKYPSLDVDDVSHNIPVFPPHQSQPNSKAIVLPMHLVHPYSRSPLPPQYPHQHIATYYTN
ncbi:C2 calcium-dependent membrane targeting [Corchorus olitorius]|uniref:C2 calcium-dependent membrane targeting n=1 Tax=Corchorus olitorius TaxID=93759 RepID=A0A1R3KMI9_9ROSI|nr:C2 calcium-dependent membrane targeting [Corchorus olitorius]